MTQPRTRWARPPHPAGADETALDGAFAGIRAELGVPEGFPPEVVAAAEAAARAPRRPVRDLTDLPFVTIDPPGAMDLDQAMQLEQNGRGVRVRYAIADLTAFVAAGDPVDQEAWHRGQTLYAPDRRASLHPPLLGEGSASLLPGQVRPAFVWQIDLDADGEEISVDLVRALVRSRDRLDYEGVQAQFDAGRPPESVALLRRVGELRLALESHRGGASLPMPEQEVRLADGRYTLRFRPLVPAEDWNAQISLLTGMAAADLMLNADLGILRTLPEPDSRALARFHRQARALGAHWPAELSYGDFLRGLDRTNGRHLALIHEATALFRGAGYTPFDGEVPEQAMHAAVAAPYAHVTAPLRRLVDRFGLAVCAAICAGEDVPGWAREALPALPAVMATSDKLAGSLERACTNAVEAAVLGPRLGETFAAVVVDVRDSGGVDVQLTEPAVLARCDGTAPLGEAVRVRLVEADLKSRGVRFTLA